MDTLSGGVDGDEGNWGGGWSEGSAPTSSPQSVSETLFVEGQWGRRVLCHPDRPTWMLSEILLFSCRGCTQKVPVPGAELLFWGQSDNFLAVSWTRRQQSACKSCRPPHTHSTLYLLRPKTLVPLFYSGHRLFLASRSHKSYLPNPPTHLSGRLSWLLIPSMRTQTQTHTEQRLVKDCTKNRLERYR